MKTQTALYPIREVSRLTGINAITLRAWERRYDLFEPVRTESGHRLFTQAHIDRINAAVKLTEQGIPISQVKPFLDEQDQKAQATSKSGDDYDYAAALMQAVQSFELERLHRELDTLFSELDDASSNLLLRQLSSKISADSQQSTFWNLVLLPRLYVRLHNMTRNISLSSSQRIWVQSSQENSSELLLVLVGLHLASQGFYPLLQTRSELESKQLFSSIQALKCQALALVDDTGEMDVAVWSAWIKSYPALEFFYFVNQGGVDALSHKLSVQHHALNKPF